MRGRTLKNSFAILDESQNATDTQIKMFLTRIGENSKIVVNGDPTQIDLPKNIESGLAHAVRVVKDTEDIGVVNFDSKDIVRHPLVRKIIEINNGSKNLEIIKDEIPLSSTLKKGKKKFTPASRRQVIPDAISWLLKYHPELTDPQIAKLIGTTKNTINSIKNREHWNIQNITPRDPVLLALCSQSALSEALLKAKKKKERLSKAENADK